MQPAEAAIVAASLQPLLADAAAVLVSGLCTTSRQTALPALPCLLRRIGVNHLIDALQRVAALLQRRESVSAYILLAETWRLTFDPSHCVWSVVTRMGEANVRSQYADIDRFLASLRGVLGDSTELPLCFELFLYPVDYQRVSASLKRELGADGSAGILTEPQDAVRCRTPTHFPISPSVVRVLYYTVAPCAQAEAS